MDAYMKGRDEGLRLALKVAEEGGTEALRKEIEWRGILGVSLKLTRAELVKASETMRAHSTSVAIAVSVSTLIDRFGFSGYQLREFTKDFNMNVDAVLQRPELMALIVERAEAAGIRLPLLGKEKDDGHKGTV